MAKRGVMDKNKVFYVKDVKKAIMDKQFKTSPSPEQLALRNYWRLRKREERARGKE